MTRLGIALLIIGGNLTGTGFTATKFLGHWNLGTLLLSACGCALVVAGAIAVNDAAKGRRP